MIDVMTQEDLYVATAGDSCPCCASEDLLRTEVEAGPELTATREVYCEDCGTVITESYVMTHVQVT